MRAFFFFIWGGQFWHFFGGLGGAPMGQLQLGVSLGVGGGGKGPKGPSQLPLFI